MIKVRVMEMSPEKLVNEKYLRGQGDPQLSFNYLSRAKSEGV